MQHAPGHGRVPARWAAAGGSGGSSLSEQDRLVAGRYRLIDQLGRGAMGVVWHGRDELLGRDVAVKQVLLPPMSSEADASASYRRTLREARTAAKLSHPGVITVFDVIEEDGLPWIVMELIRARPLDQVIAEDGPLPPAQAAQLGLSLLDALASAHAAGVLHRDVKPSNVLITPEGKAVLTDFGIASVQGDPGLTQAGMVIGTPGFSPPERVRGADATAASDLWSLGATLYAAVEGRGPFDRAGGSTAIVASIATEPAPKAPSAGPLGPVIDLLLRSDPAERPDAAATARLLTTAWTDARRLDRFGGGVLVPAQASSYPPQESGSMACDADVPGSGPSIAGAEIDATTVTQVVAIPGASDPARAMPPSAEPAAADVKAAAGSASGVVPDLMATPVFAELKMPALADSYGEPRDGAEAGVAGGQGGAGSGQGGGSPPAGRPAGRGIGRLAQSRRGLVLAAPVLVSALVAGVVFLAFPGISIGHILSRVPASTLKSGLGPGPLSTTAPTTPATPSKRAKSRNGRSPGGSTPPATPAPSGRRHHRTPGSPSASASPSPSPKSGTGTPSPSSSPSPSASPSPSPSPSPSTTGGTLPTGYTWHSVSAQAVGTTAGFRLAAPAAWLLTPGLQTYIRPPFGGARLEVNMAAYAAAWPLREARDLQAWAIAHHRYRRYHLVSILAQRFHGWPAASWTFWWKPLNRPRRDVVEVIFTAQTTAGPQPYIVSMSAPATHAAYASLVMRIAMRTFSPVT